MAFFYQSSEKIVNDANYVPTNRFIIYKCTIVIILFQEIISSGESYNSKL